MAVEKKYRCDLCRDAIGDGQYERPGYGVKFNGLPDNLEFVPVHVAEHHLCRRCVGAIARESKKFESVAIEESE